MHSRELVFEPLDAQAQRDQGNEPVFLRCKKELTEPGSGWYVWLPFINTLRNSVMGQLDIARLTHDLGEYRTMFSYLKPESVRQYPDATVRPWATCQVAEDALSFASALGYVYVLVPIAYLTEPESDIFDLEQKEGATLQEWIRISQRSVAHTNVSAGAGQAFTQV